MVIIIETIEIIGSIGQLSTQITRYLANNNNARPLTIILNIGEDGAGGNHWVSLVLNRVGSNNYGYYIDSIGGHINSNTASILSQHGILIRDLSNQQQTDGYNCGLWALKNSRTICNILEANGGIDDEAIRSRISSNLISRISEEEFEEIRDNILRELLNDNRCRKRLNNIGINQVELPTDYNDNYALYSQAQGLYVQCAISAIGSSVKIAKSKRSITEINNQNKPLLDSKKFVDCANNIKQNMVYSQLMSLIGHFKVVGDNNGCKAIDTLIKNQGIINRLKSINNTIPIEIINVKDSGYSWSTLHFAAQFGVVEEVQKLITQSIYINIKAKDGWTPLHLASQYANKKVVRVLISYNATTDIPSKIGWTPLHLASQSISTEIINLLIKNRADVDAQTYNGWAPLHITVQFFNQEIVSTLLENKANINISNQIGWTPLHLAVSSNNVGMVKLLTEHSADITVMNQDHNTPLHLAVNKNNKEIIELFLKEVIDGSILFSMQNNNGETVLNLALKNTNSDIVSCFTNFRDNAGNSILHSAILKNNKQVVELLIKNKVDINAVDKNGNTPLHIATSNLRYRGTHRLKRDMNNINVPHNTDDTTVKKIIYIIMEHKANVNIQNKENNTALHLAVNKNNKEIIELFLKEVIDGSILYSIQNNNGETVLNLALKSTNSDIVSCFTNFRDNAGNGILHSAILNNNKQVVELLIKNKVDINAVDKNGDTPLHLAVVTNNKEIIKYLIQYGANVEINNNLGKSPLQDSFILNMFKNALDTKNNTMLHNAVKNHNDNMVSLLLQAKVNLDIQNKDGNTALHLAAIEHNKKIFELLLQSRADINIKNMAGKTPIELGIKNGMEVHQLLYKYRIPVFTEQKDLSHPHRHHHGENYDGKKYNRENQEHILGNHRGRRDIEEELQIAKDTNDIAVSVGDVAVMSSSSGSSVKPIGYNIIKSIKDNIWKSINLNPIEQIMNLLNVDYVKEQVKIHDIDVSENVGSTNNKNQQDDLVKKLSIIRSIEAQIAALEESKIAETKLLKALNQKLNVVGQDYQYKYDKQKEYEEELSNSLLTLQIGKVDIQKQDAAISQIAIIKEINNEIEKIKQAIQENEQLNSDYFHAIATVKEMVLHGDITELFYEDCIRYLEQKIKYCEEEDIRLTDALQALEQQQEEYYTYNTLESIVEERLLRKIEALNTQEKKILQEEEELASTYSSNQYQELKADQLKDQIKLQESKIKSVNKRLDELYDNLTTLDTSDSNLAGQEDLSYLHETVDAKNDTAYQVSSWVNNSINLTNLSNGFIGNNTYQDQVFDYSSLDFQGNLLLLNSLMHQKNGVKYNHGNKTIITNYLNTEYAQNLAYSSYMPNAEENKEDIGLLGASDI